MAAASTADALGASMAGQHVVLVGGGGIGLEVARICAGLGAVVTVVDRAAPPAAAKALVSPGQPHRWIEADIAQVQAQQQLLALAGDADAFICTAAVCPDEAGLDPAADDWQASFDRILNVNLAAPMRLSAQFLERMAARGHGRILLVGSMAGRNGGLLAGAQYAASKGALHTFVRWLSLRAAPRGVCVNAVAPGVTDTPMIAGRRFDAGRIPAGRAAAPLEIARVIAFIASPACSYLHGQVVDVNGGAWIG